MSVVDELIKLDETTERKIMPYSKAKFRVVGSKNTLEFGNSLYNLGEGSFRNLAESLDVPVPYLNRVPNDLREYTVNYFLNRRVDSETAVLVNTENQSVRAFMNPEYPYVATKLVYDKLSSSLPEIDIANYVIDDQAVEMVTFSPQFDSVVADSPVRAGIRLLYSDSWSVYPKFEAYLCRIQCFNSSIMPLFNRKFRVSKKSGEDVLDQVEEFVNSSVENIVPMIEGFKHLETEQVGNWVNLVKRICDENRLPKKLYQQIIEIATNPQFLATVTNQSINTMYDLVNVITFAATHHPELNEQHREHLFSIAGNLMLNNDIRCPSCGSKS